jgi:hypothetical protein
MNPHALYDELLLYHETGTGISGVAFGVTESLYDSKSFSRVLVFAKGNAHLVSLLKELVYKFSKRYSLPENMDEDRKIRYMRKLVSDYYTFHTFETFTRRLKELADDTIRDRYSNMVFIIDEVHNFKSDEDAEVYRQFQRLIQFSQNRKVLLMSGTPMRDDVSEIAYIMNLILPVNLRLPVGDDFMREYIDTVTNNIRQPDRLKATLRGRVSCLSSSPVDIRATYLGENIGEMRIDQFKVFSTIMQSPQLEGYIDAYKRDLTREGSIYSRTRQASLFVFPGGSSGQEPAMMNVNRFGQIHAELASKIDTIEGLAKHSSKYAYVIQDILQHPKQLVYVYCSAVKGSGIYMLSKILELYGFTQAKGNEQRPGRRYIALSADVSNVDIPLTYFNRSENVHGDYCQVIVCSRKMSESFTFKNIQRIHILTLHWNYTEIQQAIARGIRYGSHNDLIQKGIVPNVQIYQHASVLPTNLLPTNLLPTNLLPTNLLPTNLLPTNLLPTNLLPKSNLDNEVKSLDIMMIQTSQEKDVLIRKMNRVLKEISFDCPLTYERNIRIVDRGSRDCDYQECEYACDTSMLKQTEDDLSTYRLYYQDDEAILRGIRMIFSKHFALQFESIRDLLRVDAIGLLRVLSRCIRANIVLVNQHGIECYLREDNERYYLVDNIVLPNSAQELELYARRPLVTNQTSLKHHIQHHSFKHHMNQLVQLDESKTIEDVQTCINHLSLDLQEKVLEAAITERFIHKRENMHISLVEQVFAQHVVQIRDSIYSSLLQPRIRCIVLKEKVWKDCARIPPADEIEVKVDVEGNPYGYYGIVEDDRFCIRDIRNAIDTRRGKVDKRKIKTGSNCLEVGYNKPELAEICIHLGIEVPRAELHPDPREEFSKTSSGRKLLEEWGRWNDEQLAIGHYWYGKTKKELCCTLKDWFAKHGLLVQGKCGQAGKVKESLRTQGRN